MGPLLTKDLADRLRQAAAQGLTELECTLDLGRTRASVAVDATGWCWRDQHYPHPSECRERTIYYWDGAQFATVSRYSGALVKLVPTDWGPPTFEIDGIKMLPTEKVSPHADAARKVALVRPRGRRVLDTCGGLGYFADWCLQGGATQVVSFEKNPDVLWLRSLNPWSPPASERLLLQQGDIAEQIASMPARSFDAILHDPPRFGIAGELYSQSFYDRLAAVLKPGGRMFHYTGMPNRLTSGRDVPSEVARRLRIAGFTTQLDGDGVLATRKSP